MTLDRALDRLLHDASYRRAFLSGESLDLAADDREVLGEIDPVELERTAASVRASVFTRAHRGTGELVVMFARTIAGWSGTRDALADAFMASEAFALYREVPHAGIGICIEEAFYRFCEAHGVGDPVDREHELLAAVVRSLVISPDPAFIVPREVRRCPGGWFAIATRGIPTLYVASYGRFILGPIAPSLANLLDQLVALGLLPGVSTVSLGATKTDN
jgi:hypothetical protein